MKYSTSREKLSQMHEELDRQLEQAGIPQRERSKKHRQEYHFISELDENKKSTLSINSTKPIAYDHEVRDVDIKSKKNQISELERKLMELEKKMDNFSVSSQDEEENQRVQKRLKFKQKYQTKPNEDTARFLVNFEDKDRSHKKLPVGHPSLADYNEEDSEDYFEIQEEIKKIKGGKKMTSSSKQQENETLRMGLQSKSKKENYPQPYTERKKSLEAESVMKPKYSKEKSSRSNNNDKKSMSKGSARDSMASKKSVEKPKGLRQSNSKLSIRSGQFSKKQNSRNLSKEKMNRSMDRSERGQELITRGQEIEVVRQLKRVNNLQRQLQHYKRLSHKYKQELQDYRVMEIQFRELKKNFAKSQLIRGQQKKIIDALKFKMNNK